MSAAIDLSGQRFGRLIAVTRSQPVGGRTVWRCICECGKSVDVSTAHLRSGNTRSCGCLHDEVAAARFYRHGFSPRSGRAPEYSKWKEMVRRCTNPQRPDYPRYGGRGITVCRRWRRSFTAFLRDMGRPPGYTLDRLDVNGDYRPANCRWTTSVTQARNKRTTLYVELRGVRMSLAECAKTLGMSYTRLQQALKRGRGIDEMANYATMKRAPYRRRQTA